MKLSVVFELCEEGGYHASIRELAGIHSQGETLEEAGENLADALAQIFAAELADATATRSGDSSAQTERLELEITL